jgi:hypothetical protein
MDFKRSSCNVIEACNFGGPGSKPGQCGFVMDIVALECFPYAYLETCCGSYHSIKASMLHFMYLPLTLIQLSNLQHC